MTDLLTRLQEANEAYRKGHPILSDAAYDALEDQFRAQNPDHPWFSKIGAPVPVNGRWPKVKHDIPMGSLNKAQTEEDLRAWWPGQPCFMTEKLDGISVMLKYIDGRFAQALTRGDGVIGEDITRNVLWMKGVPKEIPIELTVYVRGEIICLKSDHATHFLGESNPRNTAAGTSKNQSNPEKCQHLTILAYQYLEEGVAPPFKMEEIKILERMGFKVPGWSLCSLQQALHLREEYINTLRKDLDYDIDGLVIEVSSSHTREEMGERNRRPAGAIAFKFPHEQARTILREIHWQVGRSGRITPVAEFDPVHLAGAEVKRASLANLDEIQRLLSEVGQDTFAEGDEILVSRRNEVIPKIEAVLEATEEEDAQTFEPPAQCPECQGDLHMDGAYLVCINQADCPAQVSGAIKRWISKLGIKFLGETLIDTLCDQEVVSTIADLYRLNPQEISVLSMNGRQVGGSADRGFESLHQNKDLPLHVFVGSLGIPQIGRSMAKIIADAGFDTLEKMSLATAEELSAIPRVGESKAVSFIQGMIRLEESGLLDELLDVGITIKAPAQGSLVGVSVCMSGFRDPDMVKAIEEQGGTLKSSVGKGLNVLVLKDPSSNSSKATKARQLGVEILGIEDMWSRLG